MFDLIIQHARLCDGTGNPGFVGTLGVTDHRITYLGRDTGLAARRTMNADGLVLADTVAGILNAIWTGQVIAFRKLPCHGTVNRNLTQH